MKKTIAIATSVIAILAFPLTSSADTAKMDKMGKMTNDQKIQMHEDIAKAHQDAADCLKANKPEMECMKNFKMAMQDMAKKYMPNAKGKMMNMKHCMMMTAE